MVEEHRKRVENGIKKMMVDLDKSYLRKMQMKMHLCAAKCCENQSLSLDELHTCVERCSAPLDTAHKYVQEELKHFQDRLQRCVMDCNDKIRDRLSIEPGEEEVRRHTKEFDSCVAGCVDHHMGLIPTLTKKMRESLTKISNERVNP